MPMSKHQYPDNLADIARSIKEREGWKCKDCGVGQGAVIVRDERDPSIWRYATDADYAHDGEGNLKLVTVVLSVHHIGVPKLDGSPGDMNDKSDCRPENLEALCSRCHLLKDSPMHAQHARETRILNRIEQQRQAGQGELFS